MTPKLVLVLLLSIYLAACNRAAENKDAVRQGIMDHLGKNSGLDLKAMDVDVSNVNFQGDKATATVSFKPKSSPDAGMSMNYSLERQGAKWIVQKAAGGAGHAGAVPGGAEHGGAAVAPPTTQPPVGDPAGGALPPGHPPVQTQQAPAKK
ncbi:MAG TPA: hypothetical protein VEX68_13495 [Bryobacteraceae bacterium]|nr:hypothetical protein [Bryobacteraceae bacterium]